MLHPTPAKLGPLICISQLRHFGPIRCSSWDLGWQSECLAYQAFEQLMTARIILVISMGGCNLKVHCWNSNCLHELIFEVLPCPNRILLTPLIESVVRKYDDDCIDKV
jgi:hypothetical protein